jgi:hypothetical protein
VLAFGGALGRVGLIDTRSKRLYRRLPERGSRPKAGYSALAFSVRNPRLLVGTAVSSL